MNSMFNPPHPGLTLRDDILQDGLGFTILRDDKRLAMLREVR